MSVDIAWDTFTAGADGAVLGEKIRDFMHSKFQTVTLPRFIKAVHVHSFEFGSVSPQIEIKDICDPLPDFYEDDDEDDVDGGDGGDGGDGYEGVGRTGSNISSSGHDQMPHNTMFRPDSLSPVQELMAHRITSSALHNDPFHHHQFPNSTSLQDRLRLQTQNVNLDDDQGHMFSRSGTPGISGGTSNLGYFHIPVGGALSGAHTPLAAVASGTPFSQAPWQQAVDRHQYQHQHLHHSSPLQQLTNNDAGSLGRPRTSDSIPSPEVGSPFDPSSPDSRPVTYPMAEKVSEDLMLEDLPISPTLQPHISNPSDLQVVAQVKYDGDVRMTLTAEILLDYPMPSFVGIPMKLSVTGMRFDGVAILAYIRKRMHFCFLDPEDAQTLVGDQVMDEQQENTKSSKTKFGGLLREVHVESEIGRKEDGKQILKNVGQVEKFVLEQVRRIFEEEFVFPSFWTFLV